MIEQEKLIELANTHESILKMAIDRGGFRYKMPDGGQEAIDAGLVCQSDRTWMMSDDYRASNGFSLTDRGLNAVLAKGIVCKCRGCTLVSQNIGKPQNPATGDFCSICQGSMRAFGIQEHQGMDSCRLHNLYLIKNDKTEAQADPTNATNTTTNDKVNA